MTFGFFYVATQTEKHHVGNINYWIASIDFVQAVVDLGGFQGFHGNPL